MNTPITLPPLSMRPPHPTPAANLAQIRGEYQTAYFEWVGPTAEEEDREPHDHEYWRQCPADAPAVADHAREAMAAAERGDLQVAAEHASRACKRARPLGGLGRTSPLRGLYDAIRAAICFTAIREAYRHTRGMRIGGGNWSLVQAADRARDAMAAVERAVLTEWGAPDERRGMAAAADLAWLAVDAAQQGEPESAASYSHFYRVIRGVVDGVPDL